MGTLHDLIPDHEVPAVLTCPLTFGNRAQIEAMEGIEIKISEYEERAKKLASGEIKTWLVDFELILHETIRVEATSKEEAEDLARETITGNFDEVLVEWVREAKA